MLTFAAAVFFLIVTPGPGVLSTAGVGSAFGRAAGTRYVFGLFLGQNLVSAAVISGLAATLLADERLRTVLFLMSIAYLFYLAARIALAGSRLAFIRRSRPPGVLGGVALQIINPKAYAVNTTLFSGFSFLSADLFTETVIKLLIMNAIWIPIHFLWLWAGIRLGQLDLPERMHRTINLGMALSMMLVVALAIAAQVRPV
ncbi:LysE family translocator [Sedimentitalea todarodis]|uniref:LysE family transporter n=1 Tax=Sedimentitalea todarodis TaxID=1631240 RepID=A0ABU3VHJ5_9RHOB|nr:LysE family transporter [Sedimentitalea todarodis]MDU9005636.1 LysE family transporter [Sedimentitalea todarodis]